MTMKTVLGGRAFLEGPRWHEGALFVSDMHAGEVLKLTDDGGFEVITRVENCPSGLGWLLVGDMLVVSMKDRKLLRVGAGGAQSVHADLSAEISRRANDMVMDDQGRAYVGNFGFDFDTGEAPAGTCILRIDPDGSVTRAAEDLMFPNGMVITPDGGTLIVAETMSGCLTAFEIGPDGGLSGRRVWAQLPEGAVPDGICLDAEGAVWAASPTTKACLRLHEGSEVLERIPTEHQSIACMLGGEDGRTLFILTAETTHADKCRELMTAAVHMVTVSAPHAGRP
jgi:sugar lactone lactonase YvrE